MMCGTAKHYYSSVELSKRKRRKTMPMRQLRIAMIAPPWLTIPPTGYGGTEYVLHTLVKELEKEGAEVTLFTIGESEVIAHEQKALYPHETYQHLGLPLYESVSVPLAHISFALNHIKEAGTFDIIHDHNPEIGAALLAHIDPEHFPPVLHTIHNPFTEHHSTGPDKYPLYEQLSASKRLWFNAISKAHAQSAPLALRKKGLPVIYNAVDYKSYPFEHNKKDFFLTMGRFTQGKGQAVAAKLCAELGHNLKMAGSINGLSNPLELEAVRSDEEHPANQHPDYKYYQAEVAQYERPGEIEYVGNVSGKHKLRLMSGARALLFPIDWEEPFGMAVVEAMACGTPVVAMKRGAMPELIEHGVNGYIASNETEFKYYMQQVDKIDPADCRASVKRRFSPERMAEGYLNLYENILMANKQASLLQHRPDYSTTI
jgi:glycosyltransferase involved in cell wall biosynthesis